MSATIIFIIVLDSLMFYQILLSLQVKRCTIITYKHGMYELPHNLPNDLRLKIFFFWHELSENIHVNWACLCQINIFVELFYAPQR